MLVLLVDRHSVEPLVDQGAVVPPSAPGAGGGEDEFGVGEGGLEGFDVVVVVFVWEEGTAEEVFAEVGADAAAAVEEDEGLFVGEERGETVGRWVRRGVFGELHDVLFDLSRIWDRSEIRNERKELTFNETGEMSQPKGAYQRGTADISPREHHKAILAGSTRRLAIFSRNALMPTPRENLDELSQMLIPPRM